MAPLPKWITALEKAPRGQAIGGALAGICVVSGFTWSILMANGALSGLLLLLLVALPADGWGSLRRHRNTVLFVGH